MTNTLRRWRIIPRTETGGIMRHPKRHTPTLTSLATAYGDQSGPSELVIPETFDGLDDDALKGLYAEAVETFDALYAEAREGMTDEQETQLASLTEGIEALAAEVAARQAAVAERAERAAELAARVQGVTAEPEDAEASDEGGDEGDEDEDAEEESGEAVAEVDDAETDAAREPALVASGRPRSAVRVPLSGIRRQRQAQAAPPAQETGTMRDIAVSSGEGTGYAVGSGMDFMDIARAIDRKLQGYNATQYANAAKVGRALKETHSIVSFQRQFDRDLMVTTSDAEAATAAFARATDEARLPQGGLVASGGWCGPTQQMLDLLELETRSGLLSLPEIGIERAGISFYRGPSFQDVFSNITGFSFSEQDDIDGNYTPGESGNVEGPKPCYHVECEDAITQRMHVDGVCITAGLLMARGFPELIARTVRGALVAHEHRMNARQIASMVSDSTSVSLPADQVGATAPILTAIELQVMHYRYTHRLAENATLEAVFPLWVRSAVRADLARRQGVDLISVSDARIDEWFRNAGIAPQFVYNWQAIDTTAIGSFNEWPTSVSFLLYAAGTWARGSSPIITLDTLYDSTLLGTNDYTALFTEEGSLIARLGHDSRVVTVPICADGATHLGAVIDCDGTAVVAESDAG